MAGGLNRLNWTSDKTFTLGNTNFTLDISSGYDRRQSEKGDFTLVKTRSYLKDYLRLKNNRYEHILELGVFQGGSMVFFDKLFEPKKIIGVELAADPIDALDAYILSEAPHMKVFYNSSQDDEELLKRICQQELGGQIDLVIDDASHLYEQTRKSMEVLFPRLIPGGTYIIEDWAWSHRKRAQGNDHPWENKPSLTNLVFQIVAELGTSNEIEDVYINNNHVRITKSKRGGSNAVFNALALRGKEMSLI
jgi:cephalosporin hydroxylase